MEQDCNTQEKNTKKPSKTNFLLGFFSGMAVLSVVAFVVLLSVVFSQGEKVDLGAAAQQAEQAEVEQQQQVATEVPAIKDNESVFGDRQAKVQIIEYTDFECPYCGRHYENIKKIKDTYGDRIAFVTRHFPLSFHEHAQKAAEAVECAGDQGKFWEMYNVAFQANLDDDMSIEKWQSAARKMGLNTSRFNECLDSGQMANKISQDLAEGQAAGVQGTPGTFINGELVSGAVPFEQLKTMIDQYLAE